MYSRELEEFFQNVLLPSWIADFTVWRDAVSRYLIREIDETIGLNMLVGVKDEAEAFLKVHFSVEASWSDLVKMC